jgi:RimJ/RimL family protein N-acetyltransferase
VSSANTRAQGLYEKLGFVREGVLREHRFAEGRWRDRIVMGLLETESSGP